MNKVSSNVKKKEISNNNNKSEITAKKRRNQVLDQFIDFNVMRMTPITEFYIDKLADECVKYFKENERSYSIESFLVSKGIARSVFEKWRAKFSKLEEAYQFAKMIISARTYAGWLEKRFDGTAAKFMLPVYSIEAKQMSEFHAKLKEDGNLAQITTVYMGMPKIVDIKDE